MRVFVAVELPSQLKEVLHALPRPPLGHLRWTTPDQWHVTVAFLGEVCEDRAGSVGDALEPLQVGAEGTQATGRGDAAGGSGVLGCGAWGSRVEAVLGPATAVLGRRILCAPVEGLDEVAGRAAGLLRAQGFELEDRPFQGHLTLARARKRRAVPSSLAGTPLSATWAVEELAVMASRLGAEGSRYEVIRRIALASPRPPS